jgi:hypothetical protein
MNQYPEDLKLFSRTFRLKPKKIEKNTKSKKNKVFVAHEKQNHGVVVN